MSATANPRATHFTTMTWVLVVFFSPHCWADEPQGYVNLSYTHEGISNDNYDPPAKDDNGFTVGMGYQFNQHFALEANYHDLGGQSGISMTSTTREFNYDADGFSLSAVGIYPFDSFYLYAKVGALASSVEGVYRHLQNSVIDESGTALLYGAGMGYAVNDHLSFTLEYMQSELGGSFESVENLSAGIKLSF